MRGIFLFAFILAASVVDARPQGVQVPTGRAVDPTAADLRSVESASPVTPQEGISAHRPETKAPADGGPVNDVDHPLPAEEDAEKAEPVRNMRPMDYVRPDKQKRLDTYIRNVAGPIAITRYAATAGLLTLRNSPKEWGEKPAGYGKRFANVAAKSFVRNTTVFALDEILKVDSTFYLSRDRSPAARLRNSLFSAVTARNRRGHRVIGIPQLAGSFLSEVTASMAWYPSRYDQDHGLKGGAISIGINTGFNIFREFILKR